MTRTIVLHNIRRNNFVVYCLVQIDIPIAKNYL